MYGTQTKKKLCQTTAKFENDVKMYGTQTARTQGVFENDVKMYGTQTGRPERKNHGMV